MACHMCRDFDDSKLPELSKNKKTHTCHCKQKWVKKNDKWKKRGSSTWVTVFRKPSFSVSS